jgi:DNA-binding MarR family transcriptional regulator
MATRSIVRLYDHALAQAGLRAASYAIISRVAAEGPLTVSQLAARLVMERTTCSRELGPLVRAGLLSVEVGEDRRQRVVGLAPEGARKLAESRPHWAAIQERVVDALGVESTDDLLGRLRVLLDESERLAAH